MVVSLMSDVVLKAKYLWEFCFIASFLKALLCDPSEPGRS